MKGLKEKFIGRRIAVLMGGKSGEREVSLRSGTNALNALQRQGLEAISLDVDENLTHSLIKNKIDLVFIALHGKGGEDGSIQGFLETLGIPYTGSGVLASALAMDKVRAKMIFETTGVPTPKYQSIEPQNNIEDQCEKAMDEIGLPLVVKPISEGSSLGVSIVRDSQDLGKTVKKTVDFFGDAFLERYVKGTEVTVAILGTGARLRALPVLEIVPKKEFYDYEAKYTKGLTDLIVPARIPETATKRAQEAALKAHRVLGCHGMSRVDIQLDLSYEAYVTEVNTIPGLTDLSDMPAEAKAAGMTYDELILEILDSAIK